MANSIEQIVQAVIQRLVATSRSIPQVKQPSGPLPDEPWYVPEEDEAEVPLI